MSVLCFFLLCYSTATVDSEAVLNRTRLRPWGGAQIESADRSAVEVSSRCDRWLADARAKVSDVKGRICQSIRRQRAYWVVAIWAQDSLTSVCSVCLCPALLWPRVIRFVEGTEETTNSLKLKP